MKTFKDLKFKNKPPGIAGKHAELSFNNGYGVSVISGFGSYSSSGNPYEVAVLKGNNLCYDTHITDDVIGHCDDAEVTKIMKQIQELKKANGNKNKNSKAKVKT